MPVSPTYVGGQVAARDGGTEAWEIPFALTGGTDATPQAGDYVIVGNAIPRGLDTDMNETPPSGYSVIGVEQYINDQWDVNSIVHGKFMGDIPDTTVTLQANQNSLLGRAAAISVWRNVDPATLFETTPTYDGNNFGDAIPQYSVNPPTITPVTANATIVIIGFNAAQVGAVLTSPDLLGFQSTVSDADVADMAVGVGYVRQINGEYQPTPFGGGMTDSANTWTAYTFALRGVAGEDPTDNPGGGGGGIDWHGGLRTIRDTPTKKQCGEDGINCDDPDCECNHEHLPEILSLGETPEPFFIPQPVPYQPPVMPMTDIFQRLATARDPMQLAKEAQARAYLNYLIAEDEKFLTNLN